MCNEALRREPQLLNIIPDRFKSQEMCNKTVHMDPWSLNYVPDQFVTQQQVKLWDDDYCNDDVYIKWYNGYQKRKAPKEKIEEVLMHIAWHLLRWWYWCLDKDKEKETEKLWA